MGSLVMSLLDYSNNLSDKAITKMQCVQKAAAKVGLNRSKYDTASRAGFELHWLPVQG